MVSGTFDSFSAKGGSHCIQPGAVNAWPRGRRRLKEVAMSDARDGFDVVGIVVDWIDACRERRLEALLDLYDDAATVECCEGGTFHGRLEMERYWRPRLAAAASDAFEIDELTPDGAGVSLDYRGHDGARVRTFFQFTGVGKIRRTACVSIKAAA